MRSYLHTPFSGSCGMVGLAPSHTWSGLDLSSDQGGLLFIHIDAAVHYSILHKYISVHLT